MLFRSREFSGIAYECEAHDGLHVNAESYIVEIVKDGRPARPGEVGEVLITDLNNRCLPFIRYRIGDLAVAMDDSRRCACGRGLPRIGAVEGRVQSIVVGGNGRYVPGTFFSHLLKDYGHLVRQYRVEQRRHGAITLTIVPGARYSADRFGEVVAALKAYLGDQTGIHVEVTDHIPLERTGKRQAVVSYLPVDFQHVVVSPAMDDGRP